MSDLTKSYWLTLLNKIQQSVVEEPFWDISQKWKKLSFMTLYCKIKGVPSIRFLSRKEKIILYYLDGKHLSACKEYIAAEFTPHMYEFSLPHIYFARAIEELLNGKFLLSLSFVRYGVLLAPWFDELLLSYYFCWVLTGKREKYKELKSLQKKILGYEILKDKLLNVNFPIKSSSPRILRLKKNIIKRIEIEKVRIQNIFPYNKMCFVLSALTKKFIPNNIKNLIHSEIHQLGKIKKIPKKYILYKLEEISFQMYFKICEQLKKVASVGQYNYTIEVTQKSVVINGKLMHFSDRELDIFYVLSKKLIDDSIIYPIPLPDFGLCNTSTIHGEPPPFRKGIRVNPDSKDFYEYCEVHEIINKRIKSKLKKNGIASDLIQSVHRQGYRLNNNPLCVTVY